MTSTMAATNFLRKTLANSNISEIDMSRRRKFGADLLLENIHQNNLDRSTDKHEQRDDSNVINTKYSNV